MTHTVFIEKLRYYLIQNNLDLVISLEEGKRLTYYLENKAESVKDLFETLQAEKRPLYVIEALCMEELTRDLRPSRFNYIKELLEEEFLQDYERFRQMGVLTYETINLVETCKPLFDKIGFTEENTAARTLHYAITGAVAEYLEN